MKILPCKIALVDDHVLFRSGMKELMTKFSDYRVILQADNGEDFCYKVGKKCMPNIAIVDMNMPKMDGLATAKWVQKNHPKMQVIILSMSQNEKTVLQLLDAGVKGYLLKDSNPDEFKKALDDVRKGDFHYPAFVMKYLVNMVRKTPSLSDLELNDRDIEFLKLAATDLTYKEIAEKMNISVRTIDGYRDQLFLKLDVKSRVGLVIYALKNNFIEL